MSIKPTDPANNYLKMLVDILTVAISSVQIPKILTAQSKSNIVELGRVKHNAYSVFEKKDTQET